MITRDNPYYAQVRLLVRVLPVVAREHCFALKGGTAINLFVRDMPRLSVDIDLAFLQLNERGQALDEIDAALRRIAEALGNRPLGYRVRLIKPQEGRFCGLLVADGAAEIKVEAAPVLRGCVYPEVTRAICPRAEEEFGFAEMRVVSFEDLYAGKIMAALDRQHPRDLFDAMQLLDTEGITPALFRAFLVYLISHDGAMARVLNPTPKPLNALFEHQFIGMTEEPVSIAALEKTRTRLISALHRCFGEEQKAFLLSIKRCTPHWELLGIEHTAQLPAVRWKLHNLAQMAVARRRDAVAKLKDLLESI